MILYYLSPKKSINLITKNKMYTSIETDDFYKYIQEYLLEEKNRLDELTNYTHDEFVTEINCFGDDDVSSDNNYSTSSDDEF